MPLDIRSTGSTMTHLECLYRIRHNAQLMQHRWRRKMLVLAASGVNLHEALWNSDERLYYTIQNGLTHHPED